MSELVRARLDLVPAMALLGPRQVRKTTLAEIAAEKRPNIYLDPEALADREEEADTARYLGAHEDRLVVLNEIQRMPDL